jgi:hypothetical protein
MSETPDPGAPPAAPSPAEKSKRTNAPWWAPDSRAWASVGIFLLSFYCLHLLAAQPNLGDNKLFFAIATGLFGGSGVLAVIGFYFIASKKDRGDAGPR